MNLKHGLRSLLARGWYEWNVQDRTQMPHNLPGGAWLRRVQPTGTVADLVAADAIHPLEALAIEHGRFGEGAVRTSYEQITQARLTFRDFCIYVSQALGFRSPGVTAREFYLFTPVAALPPLSASGRALRDAIQARGEDTWAALGLSGLDLIRRAAEGATKPPAYRENFWTQEVNW